MNFSAGKRGVRTCFLSMSEPETLKQFLHKLNNVLFVTKGAEMKLQSLFETFEKFKLQYWTPAKLLQPSEEALAKVMFLKIGVSNRNRSKNI